MKIVIKRTDGGVSIMGLDPRGDAALAIALAPEHADTIIAIEVNQWSSAHPGEYVSHRVMPDEAIPADRTFRNAWADTTPELTVNMSKCREIWKDHMRRARAPLMAALDVEYQRADEKSDMKAKQTIAASKQMLRDITALPEIEAAKTPDELKAIWPDVLKG